MNIIIYMMLLENLSNRIFLLSFFLLFLNITLLAQTDIDKSNEYDIGKKIFATCAACHNLPGGGESPIGAPDLKDVLTKDRFVNEKDPEATFIKYVKNPAAFGVTLMPAQPLEDNEIKSVLTYINSYVPEVEVEDDLVVTLEDSKEEFSSDSLLIIILIVLLILILTLTAIKNTFKKIQNEPTETVVESIIKFCKLYWFVPILPLVLLLLNAAYNAMMGIGVVEKYQPSQPIEFSHKIHAGDNGIDCNYCHSSARTSKTAEVPSVNVCMNCHTMINKGAQYGESEIKKIHDAFENNIPIEWVRVHQLPDLTYFNHSQHVSVAGLECQQCHGNMEEKTLGQVATMEELNSQKDNVKEGIEFNHPTLTMGWCIDCHRQKEVNMEDNDYYTKMHFHLKEKHGDEKLTVDKLGGLECGKCHY